MLGDFNSFSAEAKRKGAAGYSRHEEMGLFNRFLPDAGQFDFPLMGRKYIWYKDDGSAISRLDRFLVSEEWLSSWQNLSQWGMQPTLSDHCAVVLKKRL